MLAHEEEERARRTRPEQREECTHTIDGSLRQPTRDQGRGDQAYVEGNKVAQASAVWLSVGFSLRYTMPRLGVATRRSLIRKQ